MHQRAPAASRPADTISRSSLAGTNDETHLTMSLRANGVTAIRSELARAEARNTIATARVR